MITKIAQFVLILSLALGVLGVSTSAALAAKPDQGESRSPRVLWSAIYVRLHSRLIRLSI